MKSPRVTINSFVYLLWWQPELATIKPSKSEVEIWLAWPFFSVGFGLLAWWRRNKRLDLGIDWGFDGLVLEAKRKFMREIAVLGEL
jgi:hypothetical protein